MMLFRESLIALLVACLADFTLARGRALEKWNLTDPKQMLNVVDYHEYALSYTYSALACAHPKFGVDLVQDKTLDRRLGQNRRTP